MLRDLTNQLNIEDMSHYEELHRRLLSGVAALAVGIIIGWFLYPLAYQVIAAPILASTRAHGGMVITLQPGEAFFTRVKLSVMIGLALGSPVIIWQVWAFIRPGLTRRERRAIAPLIPAISILFLLGAGLAYLMLPEVMALLMGFVPAGVSPNIDFQNSINFPLKVMLAFGLAFQLPVVLLGLVALRILSPKLLLAQWRVAMVVLAVLAAVVTPTGDALNWALVMTPMVLLYFGSVLLAYRIQRK